VARLRPSCQSPAIIVNPNKVGDALQNTRGGRCCVYDCCRVCWRPSVSESWFSLLFRIAVRPSKRRRPRPRSRSSLTAPNLRRSSRSSSTASQPRIIQFRLALQRGRRREPEQARRTRLRKSSTCSCAAFGWGGTRFRKHRNTSPISPIGGTRHQNHLAFYCTC
jgi:hypothetical protein